MGKNHALALVVITDRSNLLIRLAKLTGKDAKQLKTKIVRKLKKLLSLKTITFNNDQAFRYYEQIAKELNVKTYFTRPYTSQDKGTLENRNGVIRMFFPQKQTLKKSQIPK